MQFDKFAPNLPKHNILFNIYGQLIKQHPVVILFNGNERMFYFVKARSANKDEMEKGQFSTKILITTDATAPYWLFKKDRDEEKSELSTKCRQLKLESSDGKKHYDYEDDVLNSHIIYLKQVLADFYSNKIEKKLFEYELLK